MVSFICTFSSVILITLAVFLSTPSSSVIAEDDVRCLRGVRDSLRDPEARLSSWNFNNKTAGFICTFEFVRCWNDQENRVFELTLGNLGLGGSFPSDLRLCKSIWKLDLSGNNLTGFIPSKICTWLPYLVELDLSGNRLTGSIPASLGNCVFLNTIVSSDNRLTGSLPTELSNLVRLSKFSVANNDLYGPIPSSLSKFDVSSFEGNKGLCSKPLHSCGGFNTKNVANSY